MSCISQILKLKGEKEFLPIPTNNGVVIEGGGIYKDYEYLIVFTEMGHRCGYVALKSHDKPHGKNCVENDEEVYAHGGITFHSKEHSAKDLLSIPCEDEWIGFDAAHWDDEPCLDTIEKYFGSENEYLKFKRDFNAAHPRISHAYGIEIFHKSYAFMEKECHSLIDQLAQQQAGS